jgi:microbial collagenase
MMMTDNNQCLGVAVLTEVDVLNDFQIDQSITGGVEVIDTDGAGVADNVDAFPADPTEWLDIDGDGMGDNADPFPTDPNNGNCGATTTTGGNLERGVQECVSGGTGYFYVWVDADNTTLTITTSGGAGYVDIHFNADTWATPSNAQSSSDNAGNTESLTVVTNRGWRYITLASTSSYSGVSVVVE